jgi:hypothetical protein
VVIARSIIDWHYVDWAGTIAFDISSEEAAVLVRACRKYRSTMPTYLQSTQAELAILDDLIIRLSALCSDDEPEPDGLYPADL